MKKRLKLHRILVALLTILVIYIGYRFSVSMVNNNKNQDDKVISPVILSLEDNFDKNDYWVGTFNLLWNNMYDELGLTKVSNTSSKNEKIIENLNKKTFTKSSISDSAYYNKYGYATAELKKTITKDLKKKFNTTSKILEEFDWNGEDYFLYSILYKDFKFKYKFEKLENEKFKNIDNIKYFGIKTSQSEDLRKQVEVLYYQDINNFAVKLLTTGKDEVILTRGIVGDNFLSIYENMKKLKEKYEGSEEFGTYDQLKVPVLDFHNHQTIDELNGILLHTKKDTLEIKQIVRDTEFKLDESGGKLKDEIAVGATVTSLNKNSRLFYLTSDFNLFLIEKNAELPYFAMNVSDITKFQNES